MEKFVCFIKINFLGMRPYIYNVHKEQVGVGGGDLEICNLFAESIVFKRYIYVDFLLTEEKGSQNWSSFLDVTNVRPYTCCPQYWYVFIIF